MKVEITVDAAGLPEEPLRAELERELRVLAIAIVRRMLIEAGRSA